MIERIVLVKLNPDRAVDEVADHSLEVLRALPGVRDVHVGVAADDRSSEAWDLSLVLRFESLDDVETYRVHPDHRGYVEEYLKPRMQVIKAWNFEV
jgi:hypothetical protein